MVVSHGGGDGQHCIQVGTRSFPTISPTFRRLTHDNVRLYIGLIQERHDLIGGSWLVGLHYRLGGPESAQCALGSRAAPFDSVPSSRPGDPIWNIGDWRWPVPLITRKLGGVYPLRGLDLGLEPPDRLPRVIVHVM